MPGKTNPARLEEAAELTARGMSGRGAAKQMGVNHSTFKGWTKRPEFKQALDALTSERRKAVAAVLTSASVKAVGRLVKALDEADDEAAIRAADSILKHGLPYQTAADVGDRLAALEQLAAERKTGKAWG